VRSAAQPQRRVLLFVNPRARNGEAAQLKAASLLEGAGFVVRPIECQRREDLAEQIRLFGQEAHLVAIGGGDGTLNAAAAGLVATGLPLAILPLGTANDLARTLRIPLDLEVAVRLAATGAPHPIDVGEVNGVFFFNVASLGLSVEIARNLTRDMKRRWGVLGYAVAAVRVVIRLRPFRAEVEVAGKVDVIRTVQIGVGNGRHFGAGLTVDEDATPYDGKLDVFSIDVRGWWELPLLYPALRAGRHGRYRNVHVWDCEALTVRTRYPQAVNTDGEITATTPAHFRVCPGAVRVVCPPIGGQISPQSDVT
jgi:diacylglycerol kinase (ATP)